MPVKIWTLAYLTYMDAVADVRRLLEIHDSIGGLKAGRRTGVEVLNKSAVVLLTASWEAYIEDAAKIAFNKALNDCKGEPMKFPARVRVLASEGLRTDRDKRRVWALAGAGWRGVLVAYGEEILARFHTPKANNVDDLFEVLLDLRSLSSCWRWAGMNAERARNKLDRLIDLRGRIAHRVLASSPVRKLAVRGYIDHITQLVERTDESLRQHMKRATIPSTPTQSLPVELVPLGLRMAPYNSRLRRSEKPQGNPNI